MVGSRWHQREASEVMNTRYGRRARTSRPAWSVIADRLPATPEAFLRLTTKAAHQPGLTILGACGYFLFFLMLFVPITYQQVKLGLLLICMISIVTAKPSIRPRKGVALATVLLAGIGALEILYGMIRGNEGALPQITVWVLWPLVFLVLSSAIYTEHHIRSLFRVMVVAANAIGFYGCIYLLAQTKHIPMIFYFAGIEAGQGITFENGIMQITFNSFSSLVFLVPFLITLAIAWPREKPPVVRRFWIYLGIALNGALVLLSGRRALLLVFALTPILLIISILAITPLKQIHATTLSRARLARFVLPTLIVAAVGIVAVKVLQIDLGATYTSLTTGYKAAGDAVRRIQFASLMAGWRDNPVFGAGLGAVAHGPIRSITTPWAYELTYVVLLFTMGVVGVMIYVVAVGNIIRRTASVARANVELRRWTIPVMVGMISFLIANATNPYLLRFDSFWVLFLPVTLLNVNAVDRKAGCQSNAEHSKDPDLLPAANPPDSLPHEA